MYARIIQATLCAAMMAALALPTPALAWWDNWGNWHPDRPRGHYDYHQSGHVDFGPHGPRWHDTSHYDWHDTSHDGHYGHHGGGHHDHDD